MPRTHRCFINLLLDALLEHVFGHLPFDERLLVLPCVCKRWASILGQPSAAWENTEIDLRQLDKRSDARGQQTMNTAVIPAWFSRRGNCMRQLSVENTMSPVGMPAAVTADVLSSQCCSLETLCIEALTAGHSGADWAALARPTRLRDLEVLTRNVLFDNGSAALLRTIEDLPALENLHVYYDGMIYHLLDRITATNRLPCCEDLAELRSRSLTQLRVRMLGGPPVGNTLRLSGLPELRSLSLIGEADLPLCVRIDDASFRGAPQLQSLHLHFDATFQLQPGSLARLTALTSLTLMGCGLRSVPADAASLSATLCELDLSHNDRLQIDSTAVASILCCSRPRTLNLHKSDIDEWQYELDDVWKRVEEHV